VQEALEKVDTPAGRRATWHLVGHLQRNKAKHVAGASPDHSVDSVELGRSWTSARRRTERSSASCCR